MRLDDFPVWRHPLFAASSREFTEHPADVCKRRRVAVNRYCHQQKQQVTSSIQILYRQEIWKKSMKSILAPEFSGKYAIKLYWRHVNHK